MNRRRALALLGGGIAVAALTACAQRDDGQGSRDDNEDCDADDLTEKDSDCGYYNDGVWVYYPWVHPVTGGRPPAGSHPRPPKGVKGGPPRGSNGGTRTGGSTRSGGGTGSRPRPAPPPPARRK